MFGVLPINFVLYSKNLLVIVLLVFIMLRAALFWFASSFFHLYSNSTNFLMSDNFLIILLYCNILYIGTTVSMSYAFSINVLLIFDMHDLNGVLFFKVSFSFTFFKIYCLLQQFLFVLQQYMRHDNHMNLILTLKF